MSGVGERPVSRSGVADQPYGGRRHAPSSRLALLAALLCAAAVLLGSTLALAAAPKASWGFGAAHTRLKGTVNPEGKATAWSFDYIPDNLYQQNLLESKAPFQGATSAGSGTVSGSTKEGQVEARIDPNTLTHGLTYHVRLRVENEDGSFEATSTANSETGFTAASQPPSATTLPATHLLPYLAVLNGTVNPNGDPTAAWFEYGTADCESNPCAAVPPDEEGEVGAGAPFTLSGLSPETTYHYRLLAENSAGLVAGADQTFTTPPAPPSEACPNKTLREEQHAAYLPDCRAYEMVSPADKNGGNLIANSYRTRAAADGSAIAFQSLTPFGELQGSSVATDYLSLRSSEGPGPNGTGWATHGILPLQDGGSFVEVAANYEYPRSLGEFTSSDDAGVFYAPKPLTEDPDVARVGNLYLRTDLRSPGRGTYELITGCPLCREVDEEKGAGEGALPYPSNFNEAAVLRPTLTALSADGQRALFESARRLTKDTPTSKLPRLFEWEAGGAVRLAGRVPSGTATECDDSPDSPMPCKLLGAPSSIAPQRHVLSDGSDGHSRAFFTFLTKDGTTLNQSAGGGRLYLREDGHYTAELNAPETAFPGEFKPASFWTASANGERAFFTTKQPLTEGAPQEGKKLYMYDASKPGSDPHNLTLISVDHEPADGTTPAVVDVLGASRDGSYVYFEAFGQLVAGAPPGVANSVYLWHEGTLSFVGPGMPSEGNEIFTEYSFAGASYRPQVHVSPDGAHLLYRRSGLFLYDASASTPTEPDLICLSCPPNGTMPSAETSDGALALEGGSGEAGAHENHPLADDGRYVFFSTAQALVPEDTNGVEDAYEYDSRTGAVHLLSAGTSPDRSWFLDASADGKNAFIMTTQPLLGWDRDKAYDLYDVRIDGGFPEPAPQAAPCSSAETCAKALPPAPQPSTLGSGSQLPPNPKPEPQKRCAKGERLAKKHGHTVCLKPKKHRRHHK